MGEKVRIFKLSNYFGKSLESDENNGSYQNWCEVKKSSSSIALYTEIYLFNL